MGVTDLTKDLENKSIEINEENFECGLIKDDSFNEEISTSQFIDNLRPICTKCNETIGIQNIKDFDEFMTNFKD